MKHLVTLLTTLALTLTAATAFAAAPTAKKAETRKLIYNPEALSAGTLGPSVEVIGVQLPPMRPSLINARMHFVDMMRKSADGL